ncbi:hypothetical protein [Flagellimonas sp. GZD32]|uniref:hypothetical protein n=1 Tax=Flagellimonas cixiensis TaxID=3228750 RepID=UPI0035C8BF56
MKTRYTFLWVTLYMLVVSCSKSDPPEGVNKIRFEADKIICENCDAFGFEIEVYQNTIFVGGSKKVWVFEKSDTAIDLIQEFDIVESLWLTSMKFVNGKLLLGCSYDSGMGTLLQYTKNGSRWEFELKYEKGRRQDYFGNDMDFSNNYLVVGASAIWDESFSEPNVDPGSMHIFSKDGNNWSFTQDFYAENSQADDFFGQDVSIWNNFILTGSISTPLHLYQLENGTWTLLRTESEMQTADLAHYEDVFLYYSEFLGLQSFRLALDGSFETINVNTNFQLSADIRFDEDNISMVAGYALMSPFEGEEAYLIQLINNEWTFRETIAPNIAESFQIIGTKLTNNQVLIGAAGNESRNSYLIFVDY